MKQLSKDRWKIYNITKDGLISHEERLWKLMHTKRDCQSDFGRNEYKESDYDEREEYVFYNVYTKYYFREKKKIEIQKYT